MRAVSARPSPSLVLTTQWPSLMPLLVAVACASSKAPPPRYYVRAEPVPPAPVPAAVVRVVEPLPLFGQLRRIPPRGKKTAAAPKPGPCLTELDLGLDPTGELKVLSPEERSRLKKNQEDCASTTSLIAEANRKASQNPSQDGYFDAVQKYTYSPGALYHVYCAPFRLTMISLQPGEQLIGEPQRGDLSSRWSTQKGSSMVGGVPQQHIYLRTTVAEGDTSIAITTNRRTYLLEAHALPTDYMAAVSWTYPDDEAAQVEHAVAAAEAQDKATTARLDLSAAYFRYDIKVIAGKPRWTPEQVFDDGKKTFIRFPKSYLNREAPAFFALASDGEALVHNYRVRNEYYVVDGLFDHAELRLGQDKQDIVRITRK